MKKYCAVLCAAVMLIGLLGVTGYAAPSNNLLNSADSYMTSPYNAWYVFQEGNIEYSSGENPYMIFQTVSGKNWCSPALNLGAVPMGGIFQLDYDIYLVSNQNTTSLNNVIRSKYQLSVSTAYNQSTSSYYGSIGRLSNAKTNQWVHYTTTFGIRNEESHLLTQEALFCFDNIGADIAYIYLDNVELRLLEYTYTATMQPIDMENGELNPTPVPTPRLSDSSGPSVVTMPPTAPPQTVQTPPLPSATGHVAQETWAPFLPTPVLGEENLLEAASSTFEGILPGMEVSWIKYNGTLKIDEDGYEGSCLTLYNISQGDSPYLKLSKYITQPGDYTVSMMVRVACENETDPILPTLTVQSDMPASLFSSAQDGGYFTNIGEASETMVTQRWYELKGTFSVGHNDLPGEDIQWLLCLTGLPEGVSQISVDNVLLTRGELTVTEAPQQTDSSDNTSGLQNDVSLPIGWIIALSCVGGLGVICLIATLVILGVKRKNSQKNKTAKEVDEVSEIFK